MDKIANIPYLNSIGQGTKYGGRKNKKNRIRLNRLNSEKEIYTITKRRLRIEYFLFNIAVSMNIATYRYFVLHKPAGIVSQFVSDSPKVKLLGSLDYVFPEGTHAIGRLDKDSEGLLLLTTDKRITGLLFNTPKKHVRTYLVMVKNVVSEETLKRLKEGVFIRIKQTEFHHAVPVDIRVVSDPFVYYPYAEDVRCQYPHTWLLISLVEGKYRQIRKMVLSVGHRCQRLVRLSIEDMMLGAAQPGEVKEFPKEDYFRLLRLEE